LGEGRDWEKKENGGDRGDNRCQLVTLNGGNIMGKEWKRKIVRMSPKLWYQVMKLSRKNKQSNARTIRDILRDKFNMEEYEPEQKTKNSD